MTWRVDFGLRQSFFIGDCGLTLQAKADRDELSGMFGMGWNGSTSAVPKPKRDQERFVLYWATCGWCVDRAWGPLKVLIEISVHLLMWDRNFNGWLTFIFTSMNFLWISCEGRTHKWRVWQFLLATDLASVHGRMKILNKAFFQRCLLDKCWVLILCKNVTVPEWQVCDSLWACGLKIKQISNGTLSYISFTRTYMSFTRDHSKFRAVVFKPFEPQTKS